MGKVVGWIIERCGQEGKKCGQEGRRGVVKREREVCGQHEKREVWSRGEEVGSRGEEVWSRGKEEGWCGYLHLVVLRGEGYYGGKRLLQKVVSLVQCC